jgi:hypothetical protein
MERDNLVLQEASFHLQYEIGMVFETAYKLNDRKDIVVYNALLESFMIHTRNLIYFFYGDPVYDDIVASHFVFGWELVRKSKSLLLRRFEEEANKKVAHLTYQRFSGDFIWDIDEITLELKRCIQQFIDLVENTKVTGNFKQYVVSLLQGVKEP